MSAPPFEEPRKAELRLRCAEAVEKAGYTLVDPPTMIDLAAETQTGGRLRGDVQATDGSGRTYCFYVVPGAREALPKWGINHAAAAHELTDVATYIAIDSEDFTEDFKKSCEVAGAGLIHVNADAEIAHSVDFFSTLPEPLDAEFQARIDQARRVMETRLEVAKSELEAKLQKISEAVEGMDPARKGAYRNKAESTYAAWVEWGEAMSVRLDSVASTKVSTLLDEIELDVQAGPAEL